MTATNDGIINLKGVVRDGQLVSLLDHSGKELGTPVTAVKGVTGNISFSGADYGTSMAHRAISRYSKKFRPGVSRLIAIGNSYDQGAGATTPLVGGYCALLAATFASKLAYLNYGVGGSTLTEYARNVKFTGTGPSNAALLDVGTDDIFVTSALGMNDLRGVGVGGAASQGCGPNPANFARLKSRVKAMATHFLVPASAKTRSLNSTLTAKNPAVATTGSWTVALGGATDILWSNTASSTITFTTAPGNLLIVRAANVMGSANAWSITVDGISYPNGSAASEYDSGWCPDAVFIPLPTNGVHTVVITVLASFLSPGVDCVDTTQLDFSSTLIYATPNYLNDGATGVGWNMTGATMNSATANSATGALAWMYGNGGAARFGQAVDEAMRDLYEMGFNVISVDINTGFLLGEMLNADTLHRNDLGHIHMSQPFRRLIGRMVGA